MVYKILWECFCLYAGFPFSRAVGRYLLKAETLLGPDGSYGPMVPPYKIEVNYEVRRGPRRAQRTSRAERRRAGHLTPQAKTQRPGNTASHGPTVPWRTTPGCPLLNKRDKTQPALSRRRDKHARTLTDEAWTQGPDGDRQTCAAKPHPLAPR